MDEEGHARITDFGLAMCDRLAVPSGEEGFVRWSTEVVSRRSRQDSEDGLPVPRKLEDDRRCITLGVLGPREYGKELDILFLGILIYEVRHGSVGNYPACRAFVYLVHRRFMSHRCLLANVHFHDLVVMVSRTPSVRATARHRRKIFQLLVGWVW